MNNKKGFQLSIQFIIGAIIILITLIAILAMNGTFSDGLSGFLKNL